MKLVDKDGNEVLRGAKLTSFRGETFYFRCSANGKVCASRHMNDKTEMGQLFYPSVFDLCWTLDNA